MFILQIVSFLFEENTNNNKDYWTNTHVSTIQNEWLTFADIYTLHNLHWFSLPMVVTFYKVAMKP